MKKEDYTRTCLCLGLFAAITLTGCYQTTQTSSGEEYLTRYQEATSTGVEASSIDEAVREAAIVEPILRFPARIGLARIARGELTNLNELEMVAWLEAKDQLNSNYLDFVPVSPLIAEMLDPVRAPDAGKVRANQTRAVVQKIRLAAARQHLDAVLIYEVYSNTSTQKLATAVANWTIIGAYFVPSEEISTAGFANALLLDVRNGYPYGMASASVATDDLSTYTASRDRRRSRAQEVEVDTVLKLIPEVVSLFEELNQKLPNLDKS